MFVVVRYISGYFVSAVKMRWMWLSKFSWNCIDVRSVSAERILEELIGFSTSQFMDMINSFQVLLIYRY
jgi:hypothetical protein